MLWGSLLVFADLPLRSNFAALVCALPTLYAIWLLTTREPGALTRGGAARRVAARVCFIVAAILLRLPLERWLTPVALFSPYAACAVPLGVLVMTGAWVAFVPHLVNLMRRVPDASLASRAQYLGRTIIVSLAVLVATSALCLPGRAPWLPKPLPSEVTVANWGVIGTAGLVLVGAFLYLLLALREFTRALRAQSERGANT